MSMAAAHYEVLAHNYAFESENKIHSDDVASQYGFKGGLVPGVADFAYMARAVNEATGGTWTAGGNLRAKFFKPVYHGEQAVARATAAQSGEGLTVELINAEGVPCAAGTASLSPGPVPVYADFETIDIPALEARPAPTVDTFAAGRVLAGVKYTLNLAEAHEQAQAKFVEAWPGPDGQPTWHPALWLHDANMCLRQSVALGPWIHTGSDLHLFALPQDGMQIELLGRVRETYVRRGHTMTVLELGVFGNTTPLAFIEHTAIIALAGSPS